MILGRQLALRPAPGQLAALSRTSGCARWAYNWAIAQQREALARGEKLPTAIDLHKALNKLKKLPAEDGGVPWMYETSKCAPQEALRDAERAWRNCFAKRAHRPCFRKRTDGGRFRLTGKIRVANGRVTLPRIGCVRIASGDRGYAPDGVYSTISLTEVAGRWFASVRVQVEEAAEKTGPVVGIDVGVRDLAYLSDGTIFANPKALACEKRRLRKATLAVARKRRTADKRLGAWRKGERRQRSNRLKQVHRKIARLQARVAGVRRDALHKATTWIAKAYAGVVVEDLRVKNMTRRCRGQGRAAKAGLNRAILDSGLGQIRALLAYKMPLHGGKLIAVSAAYTSRTCSVCGARNDPGASKTYECASCGAILDRDFNAACNIKAAASWPEALNARGGGGSPAVARPTAAPGEARIGA